MSVDSVSAQFASHAGSGAIFIIGILVGAIFILLVVAAISEWRRQ